MQTPIYLTAEDLAALADSDRLRPVLVRYRGPTEGRFTAAAQDAGDLIACLERAGHYMRDVEVLQT